MGWGPILQAILINWPRMDRFEKISNYAFTKSELKGGPFYEKNCALQCRPFWTNGDVSQLDQF